MKKLFHADILAVFAALIEGYAMTSCCFAMIGDFNIHWDKSSDCETFSDLIDLVNIVQHVRDPTHIDGQTIDQVLARAENHVIVSTRTSSFLSNHFWIEFVVDRIKTSVPTKSITYRKYTNIHKAAFGDDFELSTLASMPTASEAAELADEYNTAPKRLRRVYIRQLVSERHVGYTSVDWCHGQ